MRVTNEMSQRQMLAHLAQHTQAIYSIQNQAASGKRVQLASDDPRAYERIARLGTESSRLDQFLDHTQLLTERLLLYDGALQQLADKLESVAEIAISAGDASLAPGVQAANALEIDSILEDVVRLANLRQDGRYLFGGLRTDTPPYTVTRDAAGRIASVQYQGNASLERAEIADGTYAVTNLAGSDLAGGAAVFQTATVDLFANLIHLRDRLLATESPADAETLTVDPATDLVTVQGLYATGSTVMIERDLDQPSGTALPGGLEAERTYYVIRVSDTQIRLARTLADARAGLAIDITDAGSGAHTIAQQPLADNERNLNHVLTLLSTLGAREERLDIHEQWLKDLSFSTQEALDAEQSVDVAAAITELSAKQAAYEAALRITATLFETSLVNYL